MTEVISTYDIDAIRADFPVLQQEHSPGKPLIFLDNAASSQRPVQIIDALNDYYQRYHANVHRGIHKLSEEATAAYEGARKKIKHFINAKSWREIVFTSGTTAGINLIAQTWGRANLGPDDVVVLTQMEHHSNIVPWQMLAAEKGFKIEYIPVTADGLLDLDVYDELLRTQPVKLVGVMHGSNVLGTVNPVEAMISQAHAHGAVVLVDAAQSVPHMPVDVRALDADFLVFSGHKMIGPTGIGVLYGKRDLLEAMPPWMGGGDMIAQVTLDGSTWNDLPYKFEAGTPSIAAAIGLGAAVDYLDSVGLTNIHAHGQAVTAYALERLTEIPDVTIYGPREASQRGPLVTFACGRIHPHDMAQLLDAEGVAVRAGHHCAQPLHQCLGIPASTRASFYFYNTHQEVDKLVEAIYKAKDVFTL
jgi:cysteine desulfurase / selenocysteine lyase